MNLGEMSWTEFEEREPEIALLPTGSTEQHGPHCPLNTDSLIAEEIAKYVADEADVLLLPSITVGVSREHSKFPGTLYLSPETFRRQVKEIILSARGFGVEKFVIVNGHGGNVSAIQEMCQILYHEHEILALEWTWFNAISAKNMGHAGELETSLVKFLKPKLINGPMERGSDSWGRRFHGTRVAYDTSNFTSKGVVGDPTKATREKGEKLFDKATGKLLKLVNAIQNGDIESPD
ncbi:creatininase family protein [Candidatus Bipolaricaulota bacterium]|nr:creatininase family protein [Candidatus Bipolaricaulota bacterium]